MTDPRARADDRLEEALAAAGVDDPRPACREHLKALRATDAAAFARALEYFDQTLVSAVAGGAEPLAHWIAYGRFLAEQRGSGRTVAVDGAGRARPYDEASALPPAALVLFLPDDTHRPAVSLLAPRSATAAQAATLDLLVRGRREP